MSERTVDGEFAELLAESRRAMERTQEELAELDRRRRARKRYGTEPEMTAAEAEGVGLRPLTTAYGDDEAWMMDRVLVDMRRAGVMTALVRTRWGLEVWREGRGWKEN